MSAAVIESALRVSTLIGLASLVVAVLFLLFRQLLRLKIFRQLTGPATLQLLKHVVDRVFVLALVAMFLAFLGPVVQWFVSGSPPPLPRWISPADTTVVDTATRPPIREIAQVLADSALPPPAPPPKRFVRDTLAAGLLLEIWHNSAGRGDLDRASEVFNNIAGGRWIPRRGWLCEVARPARKTAGVWSIDLLELYEFENPNPNALPPRMRASLEARSSSDLGNYRTGDSVLVSGRLLKFTPGRCDPHPAVRAASLPCPGSLIVDQATLWP